ncbi:DUF2953 domain-containing protein [Pseudobacteroides cellulosolvens]|uniref:DUF2953 domain-containing protein n=1 Tax=Pseudobacteroides cellulosolvens ATCC 35603 = DSM 2933 TaxID=398512 RepID=A0A0L6JGS2_9FIRM|nr:DUF2953 domain-containing protein [Pseudobacteroides cellulosolvens]KNY24900.1 Protein of unknown function DUF2953 [Pseudobacteroides cellulosolvens ATCC 35603 = DSM 2933]
MIILFVLKVICILILIFILLILFIPFRYSVIARKHEDIFIKASGSWLCGLLGFVFSKRYGRKSMLYVRLLNIRFGINKRKKDKQSLKIESDNPQKDKKPGKNNGRFLDKNFLKHMMKAVKELFYHIKPQKFKLEGRYGFEDPFYTGVALASFNIMRPLFMKYDVNVNAVFEEEILEGNFLIKGRLILIAIVFIGLKTIFNKNVRKILFSKEEKAYVN